MNTLADVPGQIYAECPAGSVVLTHGDLWHGACDNRSSGTRRVIHLGYACPSTRPQYEIAGALPQTTRERFPCMLQLAPWRNWWRMPANCGSSLCVPSWHVLVFAFLTPFVCAVHATDKSDGGPSKTPKTQPPKTAEGGPNMYQEPPFTGDDATGRHRGNQPIQYKNDAMTGKRKHN